MLLEMLVAGVCLQNRDFISTDGCPSALQAYYAQNPKLRQIVKESVAAQERNLRALPFGNTALTYIFVPAYTVFVAKRVALPLTKNFAVVTNFGDRSMILQFTFGY